MSSAPPLSTPLALARVAHVAEALLACVDSTFGVAGKDRWIRNARNQVVITNSGDAVLRSVTVTHPVASYLREVITTHAERHGDGSVSTLAMVTAGVARVAELCGRDFGSGDARRKRASLARALSRVADGALRTTLLPLAIDAATVRVPLPGLERLEMSRDASEDDVNERETGENVSRWDVGDRFRAGLRAAAATSLAGASAPATRAALARLAVTLVANTVDRALRDKSSDRDRLEDELLDDGEFADGDGRAATYERKKAATLKNRNSKIENRIVTRRAARFARAPAGVVGARRLRRGEFIASRRLTTRKARARRRGETRNSRKHGQTRGEKVGRERIRKRAFRERRRTRFRRRRRSGARRGVARRGAGRPLLRQRGRFTRRLRVRLRGKRKKHGRKRNRRPRRGPALGAFVRGADARGRFGVARRGLGRQLDARLGARRERSGRPRRFRHRTRLRA
jgi:hypothetical protein